jgi:hypothetical protein
MTESFSVDWLPDGVLMQRRTGLLTVDQANAYVAAVEKAIETAPSRWGAVVDAREASAQTAEVQAIIQGLIQRVVAKKVQRIAFVTSSAVTVMQQRRITTAPGMHDPSTVAFHTDLDAAVADVRMAISKPAASHEGQ